MYSVNLQPHTNAGGLQPHSAARIRTLPLSAAHLRPHPHFAAACHTPPHSVERSHPQPPSATICRTLPHTSAHSRTSPLPATLLRSQPGAAALSRSLPLSTALSRTPPPTPALCRFLTLTAARPHTCALSCTQPRNDRPRQIAAACGETWSRRDQEVPTLIWRPTARIRAARATLRAYPIAVHLNGSA